MIGKIRNRWKLRSLNKTAIWLTVRLISIVTLVSLPLVSIALTEAKYIAATTDEAGARVAIWNVGVTLTGLPAGKKNITPVSPNMTGPGHPLVLFFQGINSTGGWIKQNASFPITLRNDSEVSAKYTPDILLTAPTSAAGIAAVKANIVFFDFGGNYKDVYDTSKPGTTLNANGEIVVAGAGPGGTNLVLPAMTNVILAPFETRIVDVVIKPCTFTDLKFFVNIEQVN